jgi:hypothetical protein
MQLYIRRADEGSMIIHSLPAIGSLLKIKFELRIWWGDEVRPPRVVATPTHDVRNPRLVAIIIKSTRSQNDSHETLQIIKKYT